MKRFSFLILIAILLAACTPEKVPLAQPTSIPTAEVVAQPTQAQPAAETAAPTDAGVVSAVEPTQSIDEQPVATLSSQSDDFARLDAFSETLKSAIEARDDAALLKLMKSRFSVLTWNTELREVASDTAIQWMDNRLLVDGSKPVVHFGAQPVDLLGGADPLAQWGPNANVVRVIYVTGLGLNANEEAILAVGRDNASGSFYFHGVIVPPNGTFKPAADQYVEALDDLNMRSGPGFNYDPEGFMLKGEKRKLVGTSDDGKWYNVTCEQDSSGACWVSADSSLSRIVSQP